MQEEGSIHWQSLQEYSTWSCYRWYSYSAYNFKQDWDGQWWSIMTWRQKNICSSHSHIKFPQPANWTNYTTWSLSSLLIEPAPHQMLHYIDYQHLRHYKSATAFFLHMYHLRSSYLLHSVLFTTLLIHLILYISPDYSPCLLSHNLSLLQSFTLDWDLMFHQPFPPCLLDTLGLPFEKWDWNHYLQHISFFCFGFYFIF